MKTKKTLAMVGIFLFLAIRPSVASSFTERTYLLPTRLEGSCRPVLLLRELGISNTLPKVAGQVFKSPVRQLRKVLPLNMTNHLL